MPFYEDSFQDFEYKLKRLDERVFYDAFLSVPYKFQMLIQA